MNNYKKFYDKTSEAIDLFYEPIVAHNENYEYEKNRLLKKMSNYTLEQKGEVLLSFQFLIDIAYLGLNREKVENNVNIDWTNYVPKTLINQSLLYRPQYTKIQYFKEWVHVLDCKQKYLLENSSFWIQKIRNSFMHGNFEYDYSDFGKQKIKVFEGKQNSVDVNMNINYLGLHEFVEDNLHNVSHNDYGITSSNIDIFAMNFTQCRNREELIKALRENIFFGKRKYKEDYVYNGNDIINTNTGETVSRERKRRKMSVKGDEFHFDTQDFVDTKTDIKVFSNQQIELLVWILENKYNIYNASKQRKHIFNACRQYIFPMFGINKLLHEMGIYCGGLSTDKKDYASSGMDFKKTFAVFHEEDENIKNAFTILKLYRFLYRIQNKNFTELNFEELDCGRFFVDASTTGDFIKRVDKYKLNTDCETAENKAYIETLRDALAHGNIDIKYFVDDNKLHTAFVFDDVWENKKTGDKIEIKIMSPARSLDAFLERVDILDFKAEDLFDFDECLGHIIIEDDTKKSTK